MVKERTKRPAQTFERSFFRVLAHSAQIFLFDNKDEKCSTCVA